MLFAVLLIACREPEEVAPEVFFTTPPSVAPEYVYMHLAASGSDRDDLWDVATVTLAAREGWSWTLIADEPSWWPTYEAGECILESPVAALVDGSGTIELTPKKGAQFDLLIGGCEDLDTLRGVEIIFLTFRGEGCLDGYCVESDEALKIPITTDIY